MIHDALIAAGKTPVHHPAEFDVATTSAIAAQ